MAHRGLTVLILLALLVSGCTTPDEEQTAGTDEGPEAPPALPVRPVPVPELPVTLTGSADWIRPQTGAVFNASAPPGVTYEWFLQLMETRQGDEAIPIQGTGGSPLGPRPDHGPGNPLEPHGHGEGTDDPREAPGAARLPPPIMPQDIPPGRESPPIVLETAGLHLLACPYHPGMRLNVTVTQGAVTGARATVWQDGNLSWFDPAEVQVAPGGTLLIENNATTLHGITPRAFLWPIVGTGPSVEVIPQETGDFDVVVIARAGMGSRGEARARLLVDATKPAETETFGPFRGTIEAAAPAAPQEDAANYQFRAQHAMNRLTVTWRATSDAAAPEPQVAITVTAEDGAQAVSTTAAPQGEAAVDNLPGNYYMIKVTGHQGALLEYEVTATADYRLTAPPRYASAAADEHAH